METYKTYIHNPPHLFRPEAKYFITASTYRKQHLLTTDSAKEKLLHSIHKGFSDSNWTVEDWVILDNHYHLMVNAPEDPSSLGKIIQDIHKFTAIWMKQNIQTLTTQRRIWYNYRDTCITYEHSYYARLNYIWHNPVKHDYVEGASEWKFSSYHFRLENEKDLLTEIVKKYPCDDVNVYDDF